MILSDLFFFSMLIKKHLGKISTLQKEIVSHAFK